MKFNVKYPMLVEQAYNQLIAGGLKPRKDKLYKMLVDEGMIDELGNPTQAAIDSGLVETAGDNPIKQFKAENPVMANIPDQHFKVDNGRILMDCFAVKKAATTVLNDPEATAEQQESARYLLEQVNNLDHNEWH